MSAREQSATALTPDYSHNPIAPAARGSLAARALDHAATLQDYSHAPALAKPSRVGVDLLEALLREQLERQQYLLGCLERKRAAIRAADAGALHDLCRDEETSLRQFRALDLKRIELVNRLAPLLGLNVRGKGKEAAEQMRLAALLAAGGIESDQRERMLALAESLRDSLAEVKRQSSIVRVAAETLARHLAGVMQTVHSALGRAGVYTQRGRLNAGNQVHASLDVRR